MAVPPPTDLDGPPADAEPPAAARPRRRPPPPLSDFHRYPVTAAVGAAAVAVGVAILAGWDFDPLLMDARAWDGQLWRLAAPVLPHVGLLHLAFNLYWLWVLGTAAEAALGRWVYAGTVLLLAAGPVVAGYALAEPGVGLSGVGYGLFGLILVMGRRDPRLAGVVDRNIVLLFGGWFVLCWVMTKTGTWNVANTVHAAGTAFGLLLGLALSARGGWRMVAGAGLAVAVALSLLGAATRTPRAEEFAYLGYRDLEGGWYGRAADRLERAVTADPRQPDWWRNLGIARQRLGQVGGAVEAYRRALALQPQDREVRAALTEVLGVAGYDRHMAGDLDGAVELYREALAADDRMALLWYNLGLAYQGLGRIDEAREALGRAIDLDPTNPNIRDALAGLAAGRREH